MKIIGIDPGKTGGWAIVEDGKLVDCGRMPIMERGKRWVADPMQLLHCVIGYDATKDVRHGETADVAVVEHVNAMPRQGVSSTFAFGMSTGVAEAAAMLGAVDMVRVTPQQWKKHFSLPKEKRASLDKATELWPDWHGWDILANDGAAEAALMAQWWLDNNA